MSEKNEQIPRFPCAKATLLPIVTQQKATECNSYIQ